MAGTTHAPRYTVVIQWSEEDKCYVASFPEWVTHSIAHAHGNSYEETAKNAREILQLLMDNQDGKPVDLPPEKHFHYPGADVINLPDDGIEQVPTQSASKSRRSARAC